MNTILISQRVILSEKGAYLDALEQDYVSYYENFNILLITISNTTKNIKTYFDEFSPKGLIISGGNDITPSFYGSNHAHTTSNSRERDNTESELLKEAIERRLPVLCQCRGCQFLNVFFGGKLVNISTDLSEYMQHTAVNHEIEIVDEKTVEHLGQNRFLVNSYHNQAFTKNQLASKLQIFSLATDGVVEGIYHPELPIAGFMWHPERPSPNKELNYKLVSAFLKRELFWAPQLTTK